MKKETYGCACCSGSFHGLFNTNKSFQSLKDAAERSGGWSCNWGINFEQVSRRGFLKTSLATASLSALLPSCSNPTKAEPTTVFTGATVLTVDSAFSEAEAIAIRGNKILAVGTAAAVLKSAGEGAQVIDATGKTILPGFVEPHTHVIAGSVVDSIMDYVGMAKFTTVDAVLQHVQKRVSQTPAGEWLAFRNFDPAVQDGADALTFKELDAISTEHPIFVLNASGHLAYANSKAFEAAGISPDVENPPGGGVHARLRGQTQWGHEKQRGIPPSRLTLSRHGQC